ncbi:cation channel family protein (macronuclear) [Tetrahymena thermophila SB210]|uniref:Cation channel family protein n=1 Tax=Tetrahymena thermophila (strain SB210) TaxID=312017 RepID=Q22NT1_TETTS|nr:cation channel family protein [Tetrahymena thermophila SB210]EAR86704.2 cation channel family protein [Tetrahymena thermophila SB210]|eukprot:XP_977299.2 cation channel family protein [Tetrahymena thermophila SB210]
MKKNTLKLNFENTQKTHDNLVQIFQARANEKSITEDENDTKLDLSKKKMPSQMEQSIASSIKCETPQSAQQPRIDQISNKRRKNQYKGLEQQLKESQDLVMLSPIVSPGANEGAIQSGYDLKDSFQIDSKTYSFIKRGEDENGINKNTGYNPEAQYFDSSNMNLNQSKQNLSFKEKVLQNRQYSPDQKYQTEKNDVKSGLSNQSSLVEEGGENLKLDKIKVTSNTGNMDNGYNSNEQIPSNINNTMLKSRVLAQNNMRSSRGVIDYSNQRKKQSVQTISGFKKKEEKLVEHDKNSNQKKEKKANFLGVIMKMKNYAYRMASTVESKRLSILQRQKFEYLRDKTVVYGSWERENSEFNDYNKLKQFVYLFFQFIQSTSCMKKFRETLPVIPLFLPQSIWKFLWDIINMIVVIVFFFFLPLHFIYNINFSDIFYFQTIDIGLAVIASFDILINLNTAQYRKGNLLRKRTLIFLEYFSRNGFVNIAYIIMLWLIIFQQRYDLSSFQNYKFGFVCFIICLLKVIESNTFQSKINDRFYLRKMNRGIITLMQIFFNLFIVSHLFACVWLVVGKIDDSNQAIQCAFQDPTSRATCSYTWLDKLKGIQDMTFYEQYLRAYYFTTVTMITVGYGDITPVNSREYLLSILTMLIACGMFGYSLNSIGQILSEMNTDQKAYNEHFNAINGFMHKKNISIDLQFQVREYLQYFFIQSNQEDLQKQQKVIRLLPEALQNQIMFEANKIVLNISPLFKQNFSEQILQKTIRIIEQKKYRPGEQIIIQDVENDNSIYFIEKGSVEVYNSNSNEEIKILSNGSSFGEISFFTGMKSQISIKSIEFTTLLSIKRSIFFELIQSSPLDLERFCMIKDSIIFNNKYETVGIYCYCCKSSSHLVTSCNFIHLHLDKFKVIKEYVKDEFQQREKEIQRRNITTNSLQNKDQIEEYANQFIEENIDELQMEGWFNDLIKLEYQNNLIVRNNSQGVKNYTNSRTTSLNENVQRNQVQKSNSNQVSQYANIKIQYQYGKSISGNLHDYYDSHSNMVSDYTPASAQNLQIQQKSPNNFFRRHSARSEEGQNSLAFNTSKKVQFSISSLPASENDDHFGEKSSSPPQQQYIKLNSNNPNSYLQQFSVVDLNNNTPTNRLRQQSNNSELPPSSINVATSNNHVNINHANYYNTQNSGQNNSNNYNTSSFQVNSLNTQMNTNQAMTLAKGILTMQVSNQSISDVHSLQYNQQINNQSQVRSNNVSITTMQNNQIQAKQKEVSVQRGSKKRITLKTENFIKKRPQTSPHITKQMSNLVERQANENLIRQLQELMQMPHIQNTKQDNSPFEILKSFQVYMPHNNPDRVILQHLVYMRKKQGSYQTKKTKKSINKFNESSFLRNGTHASSRKNNNNSKDHHHSHSHDKKTIQEYKNILSENAVEHELLFQNKQDLQSIKSIMSQN